LTAEIIFTDLDDVVPEIYYPKPAKFSIPEWYKKMPSYVDGKREINFEKYDPTSSTGRRCIPMWDAMTAGYLIYSHNDFYVERRNSEEDFFQWSGDQIVAFHDWKQLPTYPKLNGKKYIPKFVSPWSIITPKGYSCLFVAPLNNNETPIKIIPGVVDTDTYHSKINFPFIFEDNNFEGIVPAGTPIAQVIPFKRESFKMSIGSEKHIEKARKSLKIQKSSFFDIYKKSFWTKKDYR
jgi:hypothetical protein